MTESAFYGLQRISSSQEDWPTNDYAFGTFNIDVIDRLLAKINQSIFDSTAPIDSPTTGLSGVPSASGGSIAAGRTLRYRFTYVDAYGNETAASPITTVGTATGTASPNAPTLSTASTGGFLTAGRYFYVLSSYVDTDTNESTAPNRAFIVLTSGTTNMITLTLPSLPAGATGFNVFKKGPGQSLYYYVESVDGAETEWVDDGTVSQNITRTPVNTNTSNSTNSVELTVPNGVVPAGYTWKVYRSYTNSFNSSLLAWVTTEESPGVISSTYTDTGTAPVVGHPPDRNYIFGEVLPWLTESVEAENYVDDEAATPTGYAEWQNGWGATAATPTGNEHASFYIDRDRVFLEFWMTGGVDGTVAFVLPWGYWPTYDVNIVCAVVDDLGVWADTGMVTVDVEGSVTCYFTSGTTLTGGGSWRVASSATP